MTLHRVLTGANLHALPRWEFADQTAMDGVSGVLEGDIGKMAWKKDDNTFYILSNHSPVTWTSINLGRVENTLLPDMTGATGYVSQIDIGSPTEKFRNLYIHDAYIDASSLYVNSKKVIEDDSGTITVKTDPNEDLKLLTTGTGDTIVLTDNEFNTTAKGGVETTVPSDNATKHINFSNASPGGNVTFYATGTSSQVQFNAAEEIDLTAPEVDINADVDISGSLTVGGSELNMSGVASNTAHRQTTTGNPHSVNKTDVGLGNVANVDTTNASNITSGTLPSSVLPPIAIVSVFTAANETAHLALTTQEGDVVVRTDESKTYIHNSGTAGDMTDWTEMQTPTDSVLSVNGNTGAVTLTKSDVGLGNVANVDTTDPDNIDDTNSTNKFTTAGDISKLSGIETGAEVNNISDVNATDLTDGEDTSLHYHSVDRSRANHTGTQTASTISDFDTAVSANTDVATNTAKTGITAQQASDISSNNAHRNTTTGNPHGVTKTDVGLSNVANTDFTDDVAAATSHIADEDNPHGVTKADVGLGNVPNTDLSASVSSNSAHRVATDNPHGVDKADVGLSNVPNTDFTSSVSANTSHRLNTGNPHGIDKTDVGLGNVANVDTTDPDNINDSSSTNKFTTAGDISKLAGIEAGAEANPSASEIKSQYESNNNTNAFTDTLLSKLNGIEAGADVNPTASEILTAIKTVDGPGSGLNADQLDGADLGTVRQQMAFTTLDNTDDCDNVDTAGWYQWNNTAPANAPNSGASVMLVVSDGWQPMQIVWTFSGNSSRMYARRRDSGTYQYAWAQYYDTTNVVGAVKNIMTSNVTANRACVSDGNGKLAASAITSTEISYLDGVTSAIQTQLDDKLNLSGGNMSGTLNMVDNTVMRAKFRDSAETFVDHGTDDGSVTIDLSAANVHRLAPDNNITITLSNPPASGSAGFVLLEIYDGGDETWTWPTSVDWSGGSAPSFSSTNGVDLVMFYTRDGGTNWYGSHVWKEA